MSQSTDAVECIENRWTLLRFVCAAATLQCGQTAVKPKEKIEKIAMNGAIQPYYLSKYAATVVTTYVSCNNRLECGYLCN